MGIEKKKQTFSSKLIQLQKPPQKIKTKLAQFFSRQTCFLFNLFFFRLPQFCWADYRTFWLSSFPFLPPQRNFFHQFPLQKEQKHGLCPLELDTIPWLQYHKLFEWSHVFTLLCLKKNDTEYQLQAWLTSVQNLHLFLVTVPRNGETFSFQKSKIHFCQIPNAKYKNPKYSAPKYQMPCHPTFSSLCLLLMEPFPSTAPSLE